MRPSFPTPQGLRSVRHPSKFTPQPMHIRWIFLARLSYQIGGVSTGRFAEIWWYSTTAPNGMTVFEWFSESPFARFLIIPSFRIDGFSLCLSLGVWEIFNLCAEWNDWSFEWFTKSSFIRSVLICQEILDTSQIAIAFHGISRPLFIRAWSQWYTRRPFFYSAYCSFSNTSRLWPMKC